jgi:hypothetical protein
MSFQAELAPAAISDDIGGFALCSSPGMVTGGDCANFRVKGTRTMNSPWLTRRLSILASNRSLAPYAKRKHAIIRKAVVSIAVSSAEMNVQ